MAFDPRTKLMVSLIQGPSRDQKTSDLLVEDFAARTNHIPPELVTTDEHPTYRNSLEKTYGGRRRKKKAKGRRRKRRRRALRGMVYATVNKTRMLGKVVEVKITPIFGTDQELRTALARSTCSSSVNTAFVERNNGTARHFNARKQRKTYCFSKQLEEHVAMSWLMLTHYNFCWSPRTLRIAAPGGASIKRSPAMASGLSSRIWTVEELLTWRKPALA